LRVRCGKGEYAESHLDTSLHCPACGDRVCRWADDSYDYADDFQRWAEGDDRPV